MIATSVLRIEHRGGVEWFDAPVPRRWHRCKAQTTAELLGPEGFETVKRCVCGAITINMRGEKDHWSRRNTRMRR